MAGSERVLKSGAKGQTLKEAQKINASLSALGDVIAARLSKRTHVPYRNSSLTWLLKDSLDNDSKTLMFVNVSPLQRDIIESVSSLKFAKRVRTVQLGSPAKKRRQKMKSPRVNKEWNNLNYLKPDMSTWFLKVSGLKKHFQFGFQIAKISAFLRVKFSVGWVSNDREWQIEQTFQANHFANQYQSYVIHQITLVGPENYRKSLVVEFDIYNNFLNYWTKNFQSLRENR